MLTDYPYHLTIPKTALIGSELHFLDAVSSTNDEAKRLAAAGAANGTVVFALSQTRGRGRMGRVWNDDPGAGILMSFLLRPAGLPPGALSGVPLVVGLACAEALAAIGGFDARIKWPNDVLLNGRKVAGILAESVIEDGEVRFVIAGIGVNVNNDSAAFPVDVAEKATSLFLASEEKADISRVAEALLFALDRRIKEFICGGLTEAILSGYKEKCVTLQRRVRVIVGNTVIEGLAADITRDGGLVLLLDSGERKTVCSGEASIRAADGQYI